MLFADWRVGVWLVGGVVYRFTCHMNANPLWVTYSNRSNLLYTIMCMAMNMSVQTSPHSLPMEISASYWRRENIYAVF